MKKLCRFLLIFIILFVMSFSSVYAVGINMDLQNNNTTQNEVNETTNTNTTSTPITPPRFSTSESDENFELTVSDIINIIVIAVGIVLIFLSIAILIKLK